MSDAAATALVKFGLHQAGGDRHHFVPPQRAREPQDGGAADSPQYPPRVDGPPLDDRWFGGAVRGAPGPLTTTHRSQS